MSAEKFNLSNTIESLKNNNKNKTNYSEEILEEILDFLHLFEGEDVVALSDELIGELMASGDWKKKDLLWAKKNGYVYNTLRKSLASPVNYFGFDE